MRERAGVSLVEVLVASVLLAIGVGGALGALVAAARMRDRAGRREAVVRAVDARLGWFALNACAPTDTVIAAVVDGVDETWRITRAGATSRLEGRALAVAPGRPVRLSLVHERSCP